MLPEEIKFKLALKKASQRDIATAAGVSPVSVHKVIRGDLRSQKIAECIAAALDSDITTLFPNMGYGQSEAA